MTWTVNERDVSQQHHLDTAFALGSIAIVNFVVAWFGITHSRPEGLETLGLWALGAREEFGIGVPKLDCDVSELLTEVLDCLRKGQ